MDFPKKRFEHGRHTTAHNHDVGFQQVNDVAEPERQQFHRLVQDFAGGRISRQSGLADHFAGNAVQSFLRLNRAGWRRGHLRVWLALGGQSPDRRRELRCIPACHSRSAVPCNRSSCAHPRRRRRCGHDRFARPNTIAVPIPVPMRGVKHVAIAASRSPQRLGPDAAVPDLEPGEDVG